MALKHMARESSVFWHKRERETEVHMQQTVRFLGEQDGESERLLKGALVADLRAAPEVKRAYLARVKYRGEEHVALCLAAPADRSLVESIEFRFGKIFGEHEHLAFSS
jgi:hypothetical protein